MKINIKMILLNISLSTAFKFMKEIDLIFLLLNVCRVNC